MRRLIIVYGLFSQLFVLLSCQISEKNPLWAYGEELFKVQEIFEKGQHPNLIAALVGSVIATHGSIAYHYRRSLHGGNNRGEVLTLTDPSFQGGEVTVDENSSAIFLFVEVTHPQDITGISFCLINFFLRL